MEVDARLNVSSEEFFDFLKQSIVSDVNEHTDEAIGVENLHKGFTYWKNLKNKVGQKGDTKVSLAIFNPNKEYEAVFESNQGQNIINYKVHEVDDFFVDVQYSEDYVAADKMKKLNFNIVNFFYQRRARKKAQRVLENIEAYIIQNR